MIEIRNVYKSFGSNNVLNDLSLTIKKGSIFGLVGINGAGKSTLLRLISGVYRCDQGSIHIEGERVFENKHIKEKIFFLPDDPYYAYNLTGLELKNLYGSYYDLDEALLYKHLDTFKLDIQKPIHNYSKGMKRQLFISLAIACKPQYILLDEVFDGLDPLARLHFKRAIIELSTNHQSTIIISSHALRELEDICDSYGLIDHQTIVSEGEIASILSDMYKFQVAFKKEVSRKDFKDFDVKSYSVEGKIIKIAIKGNKDTFLKYIESFDPILIDEINVSFEDLFIKEVEARGYLK
ncbi:MAG: ABC transporter ATP-binding protein [Acholeplasmataceae bacterium]